MEALGPWQFLRNQAVVSDLSGLAAVLGGAGKPMGDALDSAMKENFSAQGTTLPPIS